MQQQSSNRSLRRWADSPRAAENLDAVTGLAVRAQFRERAEQDWQRAAQSRKPVSVIMFSIDHFRDCSGAAAAHCQRAVAGIIAAHCHRRADFIARMRDHEFAVLLSGTSRQGARQIAESICKAIEALKLKPTTADWVLTVSAGVAAMVPRPTRFVDSLLIVADAGLREARRLGGNKVRISSTLR